MVKVALSSLVLLFSFHSAFARNNVLSDCSQTSSSAASTVFGLSPSVSGNKFVGGYTDEAKYSRDEMLPKEMAISQITDEQGNFLVFRVVKAPIKAGPVTYAPAGVSYSLSPAIAKEWGDGMVDQSGEKKYWLLIGEHNLQRDHIHPGQSNNQNLRMDMLSLVVTPETNEVGLNEIKVDPIEQNIILAIRGDQLECIFSKLGDPFSAKDLVDLFQSRD